MTNLRTGREGFSLIEVMVAMVIVATIAIVSARSFVSMKRSEISLREADVCKSYLDSAFKNIDVYGMMPSLVANTVVASTQSQSPSGFQIKSVGATAAFPLHSQAMVNFTNSAQLTQLNTPTLLGGTIAMLNGLYNDHSTSCDTTISGSRSGLMPPDPPDVDSNGVTSSLKITPYDLSTGMTETCTTTNIKTGNSTTAHILAPKGVTITGTAAKNIANADLAANVHNDIGFKVLVSASFKTSDGRSHSCNATHNYSYMADLSAPAPPNVHNIVIDNTPTSGEAVRFGPHTVTLNLGYTSPNKAKPGVVLMCEDVSGIADPGDSIFAPNGDDHITGFHPPLGHKFAPCEWVTLCGKSQRFGTGTQASFPATTNYQYFSMNSTWHNNGVNGNGNTIPAYGCSPSVGIYAVDMAGNVSPEVFTDPVSFGARQDCNGGWGACSIPPSNPAACGPTGGIQAYTYNWPAMYGGAACPYANGATRACALSNPCPINCVGGFGACSASCAGTYTYTITTPAQYGGSVCPFTNGYTTSCNGVCPPAPVNCVGAWGACTGACGSQAQVYSVSVPAANGGSACPVANGTSQSCVTPICAATPTPTPTPVPPTPTATPSAPCPGSWNQYNDDPSGCNIPPASNGGLHVTTSGVTTNYGSATLAAAQAQLTTAPADIGSDASWCGSCTAAACRFVQWSCQATTFYDDASSPCSAAASHATNAVTPIWDLDYGTGNIAATYSVTFPVPSWNSANYPVPPNTNVTSPSSGTYAIPYFHQMFSPHCQAAGGHYFCHVYHPGRAGYGGDLDYECFQ